MEYAVRWDLQQDPNNVDVAVKTMARGVNGVVNAISSYAVISCEEEESRLTRLRAGSSTEEASP
eukprot:752073-Hanusia_phi.AAC.10